MKLGLPLPPPSRPLDAVTIGENSMDFVAEVDEYPGSDSKLPMRAFSRLPGGEAASAAAGLARLGWRAAYIGRYGGDEYGDGGRQALAAQGVDISHSVVVPGARSRLAVVIADRSNARRTILWQRDPALSLLPTDAPDAVLASARVVLVGSDDVEAMTDAARRARAAGVRTVGDLERVHPATPQLLRELDVIVGARSFPEALTGHAQVGRALREIARASGAALVCVTLGADGSLALAGGQEVHVPAFAVDAVDTTGAGDLFRAGLIACWLLHPEGPPVADLLRYANAVAALNCRGAGAWAAAPQRSDVEMLLES